MRGKNRGEGRRFTYLSHYMGFPGSSDGKKSTCSARDLGLIPGLGRSLEKGLAIYSSILTWRIPWTDHGVSKSRTQLSD